MESSKTHFNSTEVNKHLILHEIKLMIYLVYAFIHRKTPNRWKIVHIC